jgi:cysteinyl-tRNA synthetase
MDDIIAMIKKLTENGSAYQAENGDVYFDVSSFAAYGQLSGKKLEDLRAGARVEVDVAKNDPLDFVLWKAAKPDEPSWDSPWGPGRPGWHIECSAMSTCCLGDHFDIHGGGMDLKFPHHENEIAQSEAATHKKFVNVWMHNGFVQVDEEKMSKSLGNFFTVREILNNYRAEEIRYFILSSHYRSPLNYSDDNLDKAKGALTRLYTALRGMPKADADADSDYQVRFNQAMDDDFNTPEAIAVLFELAHEINRLRNEDLEQAAILAATLMRLGDVLGLLGSEAEGYLQGSVKQAANTLGKEEIESLIDQRNQARRNKDWSESDRIRDLLLENSILLEDSVDGTIWRRQ